VAPVTLIAASITSRTSAVARTPDGAVVAPVYGARASIDLRFPEVRQILEMLESQRARRWLGNDEPPEWFSSPRREPR
jgi:hypothetical protein